MCVQYWPAGKNREEVYSGVGVTVENEEQLANFMIRTIRLRKVFFFASFIQFFIVALFVSVGRWAHFICHSPIRFRSLANFMIRTITLRKVFFSQVLFFLSFCNSIRQVCECRQSRLERLDSVNNFCILFVLRLNDFFVSDSYLCTSVTFTKSIFKLNC
jgi:hypothetical protein